MKHAARSPLTAFSLFICFVCSLAIFSCRKSDYSAGEQASAHDAALTQQFFTSPATTDTSVYRVINKLRAYPALIPAFIKLNGRAIWNKAIVYSGQQNPAGIDGNSNRQYDMVLIPVVKDSGKQVKTMLACSIGKKGEVLIRIIKATDYKWFDAHAAQTGLDGQQLSLFFMRLDQLVFGHNRFKINDSTLFKHPNNKFATSIQLDSINPANAQSRLAANSNGLRYVAACSSITSTEAIPVNNGQLFGCPPDGPCIQYETHTVQQCIWVWLQSDDPLPGGGGGIGIPGPGGSGGGSGGGSPYAGSGYFDPCNPNLPSPPPGYVNPPCNQPTLMPWEPDGLTKGDEFYVFTEEDQRIWDEIYKEEAAADATFNKDCQGTNRSGNMAWPGVLEHWMIMIDYIIKNPLSGQIEYQIPGAGIKNGRPGYADIVNSATGEMFEIKPPTLAGEGKDEVAKYVMLGISNCSNGSFIPWHPGTVYPTRFLPNPRNPSRQIEVSLKEPGVIIYNNVPGGNPLPLVIPTSVLDKLKSLVDKLKNKPQAIEVVIAQFLNDPDNAELVSMIKNAAITAGVAIIVGTIVEDFLTAGVGIADDWASFVLAYRIISFATKIP